MDTFLHILGSIGAEEEIGFILVYFLPTTSFLASQNNLAFSLFCTAEKNTIICKENVRYMWPITTNRYPPYCTIGFSFMEEPLKANCTQKEHIWGQRVALANAPRRFYMPHGFPIEKHYIGNRFNARHNNRHKAIREPQMKHHFF